MSEGYEVINLDESSFNQNFYPSYAYLQRNKKSKIPYRSKKSINYSLLAAVSNTIIHAYSIFQKSVKGFDFFQFVCELVDNLKQDNVKLVLVFDNCNTDKKRKFWPKLKKSLNLVNFPHYSPQISNGEYFFNILKKE